MNALLFPAIEQIGWQPGFEKDNFELKMLCSTGEINEKHLEGGGKSHDVYDRSPMVGLIQ